VIANFLSFHHFLNAILRYFFASLSNMTLQTAPKATQDNALRKHNELEVYED